MTTKIEWAEETWNPVVGCRKLSVGCKNCYAERMAKRLQGMALRKLEKDPHHTDGTSKYINTVDENGWTGQIGIAEVGEFEKPLHWEKPRRIFVSSMGDLFHENVPDDYIAAVFGIMAQSEQHCFQILTKRPERMYDLLGRHATSTALLVDTYKHVALAGRIGEVFAPERVGPIPDWPGYFVTTKGRILSDRNNGGNRDPDTTHELKPQAGDQGHSRVTLQVDGVTVRRLVHRLVLEVFDRPPATSEQCCHIDGDPTNNHLWNLKWGSQSDNWNDSKRHGTRRRYSKINSAEADEIRRRCQAGDSKFLIASAYGITDTQVRNIERGDQWQPEYTPEWPLPSVWLGITAETQETFDRRIPFLNKIPAAVKFLSCEPMLSRINITEFLYDGGIPVPWQTYPNRWVICGGETGPGARRMHEEWVRYLRDQCVEAQAPYFFKKWGTAAKMPKSTERLLDGREWNEYPEESRL